MKNASPLRYPGGKWRLASYFTRLLELNKLTDAVYVEPYAGSASLALSLLFEGRVRRVHLNDLDPAIHSFWDSVLAHNQEFQDRIAAVPVTPEEWTFQKSIYARGSPSGAFDLGFATFFLNRTNHSGILNGGMIGGKEQSGDWLLDARFNRRELIRRVRRIGAFKDRIEVTGVDAAKLLQKRRFGTNAIIYLDPPYYTKGKQLYLNAYRPEDHEGVRDIVLSLRHPWVVSYDDVRPIRVLYRGIHSRSIELLHTARSARTGREVMFFSPGLRIPAVHGG
jgi:DNA adenine methylase